MASKTELALIAAIFFGMPPIFLLMEKEEAILPLIFIAIITFIFVPLLIFFLYWKDSLKYGGTLKDILGNMKADIFGDKKSEREREKFLEQLTPEDKLALKTQELRFTIDDLKDRLELLSEKQRDISRMIDEYDINLKDRSELGETSKKAPKYLNKIKAIQINQLEKLNAQEENLNQWLIQAQNELEEITRPRNEND